MSLLDTLRQEHLKSRKERDELKSKLLSTLLGDVQNAMTKKGNTKSGSEIVLATAKKFLNDIKTAHDAITDEEKRAELLEEARIITDLFIPSQLTIEELTEIVATMAPANLGAAMKELKNAYAGRYDGVQAKLVVEAYLASK